jgi:hypothetical protein
MPRRSATAPQRRTAQVRFLPDLSPGGCRLRRQCELRARAWRLSPRYRGRAVRPGPMRRQPGK